jgi:phosphoribosylanthranilate isomerase
MFRVKVCGITRIGDAFEAVRLGFDALGFIFAPGLRMIEPDNARAIIGRLPPFVTLVGVFVDEEASFVRHTIQYCGLDLVQFHGAASPEFCESFFPRSIKSINLNDPAALDFAKSYRGTVRALHFDTHAAGGGGGTGIRCDWNLAREGMLQGLPVILAGGLDPDSAVDALVQLDPYAIDVNSGVEERPGIKSHVLMQRLAGNLEKAGKGVKPW